MICFVQVLFDWLLRDESVKGLALEQLRERFLMAYPTYKGLLPYFNPMGEFDKWGQVCSTVIGHSVHCK